jgi:hypothetical protein
MALITATQITKDGVTRTLSPANSTDTLACGDRTFLEVANGSGGSINVTITTPNTVSGLAVADLVVAVGNGVTKIIGPITRELFGNDDGIASIAYSSTTSVTAAAFKI